MAKVGATDKADGLTESDEKSKVANMSKQIVVIEVISLLVGGF